MAAALVVGIAVGGHRLLALASLVVALGAGTYLRRFGPRGFIAGNLLFMGDFFGFFLHGAVTMSKLPWLLAELGIGVAVAAVVRFTLVLPATGQGPAAHGALLRRPRPSGDGPRAGAAGRPRPHRAQCPPAAPSAGTAQRGSVDDRRAAGR